MYILKYVEGIGYESTEEILCKSDNVDRLKKYVADESAELFGENWYLFEDTYMLDLGEHDYYVIEKIKDKVSL